MRLGHADLGAVALAQLVDGAQGLALEDVGNAGERNIAIRAQRLVCGAAPASAAADQPELQGGFVALGRAPLTASSCAGDTV